MSTPINIGSKGYGKIYKAVMRNPKFPLLAKTIYTYFASFAGVGTTAFLRRNTIMRELKLSVNTYYEHFNSLIDTGYLRTCIQKRLSKVCR